MYPELELVPDASAPTQGRTWTTPAPTRAERATRRSAWPFAQLSDEQKHQNALMQIAARNGTLAGPPSCFEEVA